MKKLIVTFFLLCFNYFLVAQESFQVARIIKCDNEAEVIEQSHTYDSPNKRFMPRHRELQQYIVDWVKEGQLQAFACTPQLADFSKTLSIDDFNDARRYYDEIIDDEVTLVAPDLYKIGIEESVTYYPDKQSFDYKIQTLVLYIPDELGSQSKNLKGGPVARFRYDDLVKLWSQSYQASLQEGMYEKLACFFQLYEDNTSQVSFQEAFEQRLFQAETIQVIPEEKEVILEKEINYQPNKTVVDDLLYAPQFMRLDEKTIRTTIVEQLDLRKELGFFREENTLTKSIIEGVRQGKITPYYSYTDDVIINWEQAVMTKERFESELTYYDPVIKEDVRLRNEDIYIIEVTSIVDIEEGKKISYTPYQLSLLISREITMYGFEYEVATFKFEELVPYFKAIEKELGYAYNKSKRKKISFDKVFQNRFFKQEPQIMKFSNILDDHISNFVRDYFSYYGDYPETDIMIQKEQEEGNKVRAYLESLAGK